MLPVTEGLSLGTHLVRLVFIAWQIAQCLHRVAFNIRWDRRLVIGEMDCDELIDELMSVADPQGTGAGLAEGAPPAAATPDAPLEEERVQKHPDGSLPSPREAKPGCTDWWSAWPSEFTADQIDTLDNSEIKKLNALYHSAVVSGLAMGCALLGKMAMGAKHPQAWSNALWRWHGGARRRSGHGNQGPAN